MASTVVGRVLCYHKYTDGVFSYAMTEHDRVGFKQRVLSFATTMRRTEPYIVALFSSSLSFLERIMKSNPIFSETAIIKMKSHQWWQHRRAKIIGVSVLLLVLVVITLSLILKFAILAPKKPKTTTSTTILTTTTTTITSEISSTTVSQTTPTTSGRQPSKSYRTALQILCCLKREFFSLYCG